MNLEILSKTIYDCERFNALGILGLAALFLISTILLINRIRMYNKLKKHCEELENA